MEKDILSLIEKESAGFSKSQRKIAAFITRNYDKAAFMTAARLGKGVHGESEEDGQGQSEMLFHDCKG